MWPFVIYKNGLPTRNYEIEIYLEWVSKILNSFITFWLKVLVVLLYILLALAICIVTPPALLYHFYISSKRRNQKPLSR